MAPVCTLTRPAPETRPKNSDQSCRRAFNLSRFSACKASYSSSDNRCRSMYSLSFSASCIVRFAFLSHRGYHSPGDPSSHGRRDHMPTLADQFLFRVRLDLVLRGESAPASDFLFIEHTETAFLNVEGARVRRENDPASLLCGKSTKWLVGRIGLAVGV